MKRFCCETWPRSHGKIAAKTSRRFSGGEGLKFGAAERLRVAAVGRIFFLDELRRALDEIQGAQVAFLGDRRPTK